MFLLIFVSILALCGAAPSEPTKAGLQIVGGTAYSIATVPYQAAMEYGTGSTKYLRCGATIISNFYLLTAAHCRGSTYLPYYRIRVGTNITGSNGLTYNLAKFVIHSSYSSSSQANDIAYLRTTTSITYSTNVRPASLIVAGGFTTTQPLLITGWGTTSSGGSISRVLLGAVINFVSDATCKTQYGSTNIRPGMICAAALGKDTCQGDSGGPMVIAGNKTLVGITSWGYGCADPRYAGVYTSVAYFRNWIKTNTGV
jgi:secreted trypsin-like serine protease